MMKSRDLIFPSLSKRLISTFQSIRLQHSFLKWKHFIWNSKNIKTTIIYDFGLNLFWSNYKNVYGVLIRKVRSKIKNKLKTISYFKKKHDIFRCGIWQNLVFVSRDFLKEVLLSKFNQSLFKIRTVHLDIFQILSLVITDIYRLSHYGSTGNTKINETVSVFKDRPAHCWSYKA